MPRKRLCSGEEKPREQQPDRAMQKSCKRVCVAPTADFGPTWVTGWKTMQTPEGLLDLVLEDAYAYLDALERRKGSLLDAAPSLILRGRPGGSRREGPTVQRFSLDLSGFSPEDVSVQLDGRKLKVTAKRDRQSRAADGCVSRDAREMYREVMLADDADLESVACALSDDGQLRIEAPRLPPPPPPERVIPIRREEAVEQGQKDGAAGGEGEKQPKAGK